MALFILPVSDTLTNYEFEVSLDGVIFRLRLKFNDRSQAWFLDLFDADGVALRSGIRLVSDWFPLRLFQGEGRPAGDLVVINLSPDARISAPDEDQLGQEVVLAYSGTT
jgi:hypothetical protein